MNSVGRDFPYTEEAQHVVNTISIEILRHVLEATYPPATAVFYHLVPVVCRESPVLSVYGEVVWRCSSLSVEVEVTRLLHDVTSVAVNANRNVTLEDNTLLTCIFVCLAHLATEHILHEVIERHLFLAEVVALAAIFCIRLEPLLRLLEETLIRNRLHHVCAFLLKQ